MPIEFNPHTFSNANVQFMNGSDDQILYSYCGRFTQLGKDYGTISVAKLKEINKAFDIRQAFTPEHFDPPGKTKVEIGYWFAMNLKYFYAGRSVIVLNDICDQKKKIIEERISKKLIVKIVDFILKFIPFLQFRLKNCLSNLEFKRSGLIRQKVHTLADNGQIIFMGNYKEVGYGLARTISNIAQQLGAEENQLIKDKITGKLLSSQEFGEKAQKLLFDPKGKFEDSFELAGKLAEDYTIHQIYNMNLPQSMSYSHYLNGHLHDSISEHGVKGHNRTACMAQNGECRGMFLEDPKYYWWTEERAS